MSWRPLPGSANVARGAAPALFTLKGRHLKHGTNPPNEVTTVAQMWRLNSTTSRQWDGVSLWLQRRNSWCIC